MIDPVFLRGCHEEALKRVKMITEIERDRKAEMLTSILIAAELAQTYMDRDAFIRGCEAAWNTAKSI